MGGVEAAVGDEGPLVGREFLVEVVEGGVDGDAGAVEDERDLELQGGGVVGGWVAFFHHDFAGLGGDVARVVFYLEFELDAEGCA